MTKLCKPTKEAILFRVEAFKRHAKGNDYLFNYPIPIEVFGLQSSTKEGELSLEDLINELKLASNPL